MALSMRSRHGCSTCRARKVKCDEERPVCGQCRKAGRACTSSDAAIFRNYSHSVLHPGTTPAPAPNPGQSRGDGDPLEFDCWVDIPKGLTFIHIENPYEWDGIDEVEMLHAASSQSCTIKPAPASDSPSEDADFGANAVAGPNPQPLLLDAPPSVSPNGRSELSQTRDGMERNLASFVPDAADRPHEPGGRDDLLTLRLVRHFQEGPGYWMDIYDTNAYFSRRIPTMASSSDLIKYSICAIAAKHQQRLATSQSVRRSHWKLVLPQNSLSWDYIAAQYYDKAISGLKSAVQSLGVNDGLVHSSQPPEEIFAVISILTQYELMDTPGTAWSAHLSAFPLFIRPPDEQGDGLPTVTIPQNAIKGPIFWSLARQDILCAFTGETQTRFQIGDLRLWHHAGLVTADNRFQLPFSPDSLRSRNPYTDVEEDFKANELVCIFSKLLNFIAAGDAVVPIDYARPEGERLAYAVSQEILLKRWREIKDELQQWQRSLPDTFTPAARTLRGRTWEPPSEIQQDPIEQIWYDTPVCAAAMVSFHMACILLHANRPQESTAIRSTVSARLQTYRHDTRMSLFNAREICGILTAEVPDSVLILSVQAIFVAGQVFYHEADQKLVLRLLTDIEKDLGWPTSHYVAKLQDEWRTASGLFKG